MGELFGSRDAQCEKCRAIYRLGDEHVCAVQTKSKPEDRGAVDEGQGEEAAPVAAKATKKVKKD